MNRIRSVFKFVHSLAVYYIRPTPPDFVLSNASTWTSETGEVDETPQIITWLATKKTGLVQTERPECAESKRLIVRYRYRGAGPYACYYGVDDNIEFPPHSKLTASEEDSSKIIKNPDDCVSVAEILRNEEEVADITDSATAYAGPDGKWHGRSLRDKTFDPLILYKDIKTKDVISISYADGKTIEITY